MEDSLGYPLVWCAKKILSWSPLNVIQRRMMPRVDFSIIDLSFHSVRKAVHGFLNGWTPAVRTINTSKLFSQRTHLTCIAVTTHELYPNCVLVLWMMGINRVTSGGFHCIHLFPQNDTLTMSLHECGKCTWSIWCMPSDAWKHGSRPPNVGVRRFPLPHVTLHLVHPENKRQFGRRL